MTTSRKIVFTVGNFDRLNAGHLHLIKEMRKQAVPGGEIRVFLFSDYSIFLRDKFFPIQDLPQRKSNLEYICKREEIFTVADQNPEAVLRSMLAQYGTGQNTRYVYMAGKGSRAVDVEVLKNLRISRRIINPIQL